MREIVMAVLVALVFFMLIMVVADFATHLCGTSTGVPS